MGEETTQQLPNDALKVILARFDSMDARHTALEEKVDRRLQETRPIWESVLAEMKEVNTRLTKVENDYKDFRRLFHSTFSSLVRGQEDIIERLDKFEAREVPK
jgi:hypothetical protein